MAGDRVVSLVVAIAAVCGLDQLGWRRGLKSGKSSGSCRFWWGWGGGCVTVYEVMKCRVKEKRATLALAVLFAVYGGWVVEVAGLFGRRWSFSRADAGLSSSVASVLSACVSA